MTKQPFTVTGIATKQKELHALGSAALKPELDALKANFPGWIETHFVLKKEQTDFLHQVDPIFISGIAPDIAASLNSRIDIDVLMPRENDPPLGSKFMAKERSLKYHYDSQGGLQVSGQLLIRIGYTGAV